VKRLLDKKRGASLNYLQVVKDYDLLFYFVLFLSISLFRCHSEQGIPFYLPIRQGKPDIVFWFINSRQIPVQRFGKELPPIGGKVSSQSILLPPSIPRGCARPDGDVSIAGGLPLKGFEGALLNLLVAAREMGISPSP
jgi:hypothetical protein